MPLAEEHTQNIHMHYNIVYSVSEAHTNHDFIQRLKNSVSRLLKAVWNNYLPLRKILVSSLFSFGGVKFNDIRKKAS